MDTEITDRTRDTVPSADPRPARLAAYITHQGVLDGISRGTPYGHMGATITDVALQARWNYAHTVRPRAKQVRARYPEAATTTLFCELIADPIQAQRVLKTKHVGKIRIAQALAAFLAAAHVETEEQLRTWVDAPGNRRQLLAIHGVGPKTAAYLAIRAGAPDAVAVDVHLRRFLGEAPIDTRGDGDVVITAAARILGMAPADLDGAIWRYQRRQRRGRRGRRAASGSRSVAHCLGQTRFS